MDRKSHLMPSVHMWYPSDSSSCIISEEKCSKIGTVMKCASCHITLHRLCLPKNNYECKPTFIYSSNSELSVKHHWIIRKRNRGKCISCEKNFDTNNLFVSSKPQASIVVCCWCKRTIHTFCFYDTLIVELCDHGALSSFIIPYTWIVQIDTKKLDDPDKNYKYIKIESSIVKKNKNHHSFKEPRTKDIIHRISSLRWSNKGMRALVIKPHTISSNVNDNIARKLSGSIPLIVFINPKSGNTKGYHLLLKFMWLLNPRQVFDLSKGGPKLGLRLYRHVPNLHIIVCGGDGTVGWILTEIDKLEIKPSPSISLIPLGTGNDLARVLNWGGGYQDEPLSSVLFQIESASPFYLDRWKIEYNLFDPDSNNTNLHTCINNYFSFGADAEVAMEFHESRKANPERFNNRFKNKIFYGKAGGMAVIKGTGRDIYKNLNDFIVDGKSIMEKIIDIKPQVILFQNISKYSAGTNPWGSFLKDEYVPQSCNDKFIEVVAMTSTSMITNQFGGHGIRLAQCSNAKIITNKVITAQVDGEPYRINPAEIKISFLNQARLLARRKHATSSSLEPFMRRNTMYEDVSNYRLIAISEDEYQNVFKLTAESIRGIGRFLTVLELRSSLSLAKLRLRINYISHSEMNLDNLNLKSNWVFVDAGFVVPRIYCIDTSNEDQFSIRDISLQKSIIIVVPNAIKPKTYYGKLFNVINVLRFIYRLEKTVEKRHDEDNHQF